MADKWKVIMNLWWHLETLLGNAEVRTPNPALILSSVLPLFLLQEICGPASKCKNHHDIILLHKVFFKN